MLAHSLRDNGSKAKLVVLFPSEHLRPETVNELKVAWSISTVLFTWTLSGY